MPRICTACSHAQRAEINEALVAGRQPIAEVGDTFHLSESALRRHRSTHLPPELRKAHAEQGLADARSLRDQLQAVQRRLVTLLDQAEASGDLRTAISALREIRNNLSLLTRSLDRDVTVIDVSVMELYIRKVVEILNDFVPDERRPEAFARLTSLGAAILETSEEVAQ